MTLKQIQGSPAALKKTLALSHTSIFFLPTHSITFSEGISYLGDSGRYQSSYFYKSDLVQLLRHPSKVSIWSVNVKVRDRFHRSSSKWHVAAYTVSSTPETPHDAYLLTPPFMTIHYMLWIVMVTSPHMTVIIIIMPSSASLTRHLLPTPIHHPDAIIKKNLYPLKQLTLTIIKHLILPISKY